MLVFDRFLSCCCSDHPGIEALFEPHCWLEVLVILLASKKRFLGGHWDQVSFPGKLCYFSIFVYCCMIGIGKKLTQSFLRPKTSSSTPASFLINMGNHLSITPLISLDFLSSLNFPLLSSPPNSPPDFDLSVLD